MAFVPDKTEEPSGTKFVPDEKAKLDAEVTGEKIRVPWTDTYVPGTSGLNQFIISTGRGMVDLWEGTNQVARIAADIVSPRQTKHSNLIPSGTGTREAEYTKNEVTPDLQQFSKMETAAPWLSTGGRILGQAAVTAAIPAGTAAHGVRALSTLPGLSRLAGAGFGTDATIMGGLQGFLNVAPEGQSHGVNAAEGGAAGGIFAKSLQLGGHLLGPSVRRGADWLRSKADDMLGMDLGKMAGTRAGATPDELAAALKSEGIDWSTLPTQVRDGVRALADDAAKGGTPITPAELARVVRAQNLPGGEARLTKGQMTQDRQQLREEFNLRSTKSGQTLDQQLIEQDKVLGESLDVLKLKSGAGTNAQRPAETGEKLTAPLVKQLNAAQGKVTSLYEKADKAGETLQAVNPQPLIDWLSENFAALHSAPAMKSLAAQLKKTGLVTVSEDGVASAGREPTVRELESLRQAMVKWGKADDASGHWMGEGKKVIDAITEGKGGELYKEARQARIALRDQFEDPGVIHSLVGQTRTGERITDFDKVFQKTVLGGSRDDLNVLKKQLLTGHGENEELGKAGVQAFRDLRGATLDYLKLGALNNAKDEFSYAGFKRAVDSLGPEKLEVIFGKNTANQIISVLESTKDMKAPFNKSGIYNPGSASAFVDWIDRITGLIGLGKAGTYTSGAAKKVWEGLHESARVGDATKPLEGVRRAGEAAKDDAYRQLLGLYGAKAGARAAPAVAASVSAPESTEQ